MIDTGALPSPETISQTGKNGPSQIIGWGLLGLNLLMLVILLLVMAVIAQPNDSCASKAPPLRANVAVMSVSGDMHIGGAACIAVRSSVSVFKSSENLKIDELPHERVWNLSVNGAQIASAMQPLAQGGEGVALLEFHVPAPENANDPVARVLRSVWVSNQMLSGSYRGDKQAVFSVSAPATDKLQAIAPQSGSVTLRIHYTIILWLGLALLLSFIAGMFWLFKNSGIIRDRESGALSLSLAQMAFWFMLTAAGFLYIWLTTGQWRNVVSNGTLALLGISSVTGLMGTVGKKNGEGEATGNWFAQLLSDTPHASLNTVGLHRVIMVVWTFFLGAIFINQAFFRYEFADFDTALLILSGIVGGVYVGFKKAG